MENRIIYQLSVEGMEVFVHICKLKFMFIPGTALFVVTAAC